jgi:cysteine synthase A
MFVDDIDRRMQGLTRLVGNTPLLAIEFLFRGKKRILYAKAEHLNMTGSIKDRMALHILRKGYERGALKPHGPIIEATSGNTGISFAAIGRALGHPVSIFMPEWMSEERIALMRSHGADIHLVSEKDGGFVGCIKRADELALTMTNAFLPAQFSNEDNVDAHATATGPEIWWQLSAHSLQPDALLAGVGTGGTVMGAGLFLKRMQANVKVHPLEPANSPTLSTGCHAGKHRIQGISDEFVPPIVDLSALDHVVSADDGDSIVMAQKLAAEIGLAVGISSGANFLGALAVQSEMGEDAVVVTFFPDDNKKYLSTDLTRTEPLGEEALSPEVRLLGFRVFNRVCEVCYDLKEASQTEPLNFSNNISRSD